MIHTLDIKAADYIPELMDILEELYEGRNVTVAYKV